jgi:hypothetical protein
MHDDVTKPVRESYDRIADEYAATSSTNCGISRSTANFSIALPQQSQDQAKYATWAAALATWLATCAY